MLSNLSLDRPTRELGRIAGLLYLIVAISGGFAQIVRLNVIETDDAAATAANVLDGEWLFRLGFSSDVVAFSTEVVLGLVVYALFRPINAPLALLAAFLRLAQAAVLGINMLNQFVVLLLLDGGEYLGVFDPAQLDALVLLFLEAHAVGYFIGLVFFGLHNIVLGYLVLKSGYLPRVLGIVLMVIVSTGYLADSFGNFLFSGYPSSLSVVFITPAALAEFAVIFWLLAKGVATGQRDTTALAPAPMAP
jgi:hypothetical protein